MVNKEFFSTVLVAQERYEKHLCNSTCCETIKEFGVVVFEKLARNSQHKPWSALISSNQKRETMRDFFGNRFIALTERAMREFLTGQLLKNDEELRWRVRSLTHICFLSTGPPRYSQSKRQGINLFKSRFKKATLLNRNEPE